MSRQTTKICRNCDAVNPADYRYCFHCRAVPTCAKTSAEACAKKSAKKSAKKRAR